MVGQLDDLIQRLFWSFPAFTHEDISLFDLFIVLTFGFLMFSFGWWYNVSLLLIITGIGWFLSSSPSFGLSFPSLRSSSARLRRLAVQKVGQMVGQLEVWDPRIPVVNQPWWVLELHCGYTSSSHQ